MPVREIQSVQNIRVGELVRRDKCLINHVVHLLTVPRLLTQDRNGNRSRTSFCLYPLWNDTSIALFTAMPSSWTLPIFLP